MRSLPLNWRFLLLTLAVTLGLFGWGISRLEVDTDILGALPRTDPVVADGTYLLLHHPMQNLVVVDVALDAADLDTLVACGRRVESRLRESGLFKSVGMEDAQALHAGADRATSPRSCRRSFRPRSCRRTCGPCSNRRPFAPGWPRSTPACSAWRASAGRR